MKSNFQEEKYQAQQQKFDLKNDRLQKAIKHKRQKSIGKKIALKESIEEEDQELVRNLSNCDSDEDQMEYMDNLMEKASIVSSEEKKKEKKLSI